MEVKRSLEGKWGKEKVFTVFVHFYLVFTMDKFSSIIMLPTFYACGIIVFTQMVINLFFYLDKRSEIPQY